MTALARDMRGVQTSVLANRDDPSFPSGPLSDMRDQVASAFARYPYPESFFVWRADSREIVVFNRANRPPPWSEPSSDISRYPVALVRSPSIDAVLFSRTKVDIAVGRQYSIFETRLAGHSYQVVARLQYDGQATAGFVGAFGCTVNLDWVTRSYFAEIAAQVSGIGDSVLLGFRHQLTEAGFEVVVDVPSDLPLVRVDRTSMRLALDNLIDNVIRYAGDGRWIGISATGANNFVTIEVRDHGIGIPREDLPLVQKKFVRGRLASPGGNGLGLAIVARIVKDHGGTFSIASVVGAGTTVPGQLDV